jgi:hypothetical protein
MAKKQELVLNTGKLSGACGRLMCCLGFEYSDTYPEDIAIESKNGETISVIEEAEEGELIVASSEPIPEAPAPEPQEQKQTEQKTFKKKRRRWRPRRRKKKKAENP